MKVHHMAVAAILLGTGWSTNVVYKYSQSHQERARVIASQEKDVTHENASVRIQETEKISNDLSEKVDAINKVLEQENPSLSDLIEVRESNEADVHELYRAHLDDKTNYKNYFDNNTGDSQQVAEIGKRYGVAVTKVEELEISKLMNKLNEKIQREAEKKTAAQEEALKELSANICEQNRELSSLTSSIKELIKDKEDVVDEVEEREGLSVEDALAMFSSFSMPYQMNPSDFFAQTQPIGLQSQQNPLGLDMNFLMMTNMLANTNGFGPRASINYAPVYNQQRSYYGMPQFSHHGGFNLEGDNLLNSTNMMPNARNTNEMFLQGVQAGFHSPSQPIFDRGNGLQGAFAF